MNLSTKKINEPNKKEYFPRLHLTTHLLFFLFLLSLFLLWNLIIFTFSAQNSPLLNSSGFLSQKNYFLGAWQPEVSAALWLFFGSTNYLILALGWLVLGLLFFNKNRHPKKIFFGALLLLVNLTQLISLFIENNLFSFALSSFSQSIFTEKISLFFDQQLAPRTHIPFIFIGLFIGTFLLFNCSFLNAFKTLFFFIKKILKQVLFFTFLYFKKILLFLPWLIKRLLTKKSGPEIATQPITSAPQKKETKRKSFFSSSTKTDLPLPRLTFFTKKEGAHDQNRSIVFNQNQKKILEETLAFFGIYGHVESIHSGPVITLFEYVPDLGSKISKIIALEHDLALKLKAQSLRIIAPIPGKHCIGFEIAHDHRETVYFSNLILKKDELISSEQIPLIIGVDSMGNPAIIDLPSMPHLLIAGSTGSGKSVGMHSIVASIIALQSYLEVKIIMIDPKRLEFSTYHDIPHLIFPLIHDATKAAAALSWLVKEMERRYIFLAQKNMRNISDYHANDGQGSTEMPFIVVLIDELADLMMVAGKEIELELARLAQMARAAGIFLIVATQRPSVDVITGLIKVNFPSRIAYRVTSKIDSRTILDQMGADKLLGKGDLLFLHAASTTLQRLHGAFLDNKEINALANEVRALATPEYQTIELENELNQLTEKTLGQQDDPLYEEIKESLSNMKEISISMIQRHYRIGFNRSARIIEQLESEGLIGPAQGSKPRKIM